MKFLFHFLIFFAVNAPIFAQKITGIVRDSQNEDVLAFVNILACQKGTVTDLQGKFVLHIPENCPKIVFSFVGYKPYTLNVNELSKSHFEVKLEPTAKVIAEFVVAGENPAHKILKKMQENKNKNDPKKIASFSYECYNKFVFDPVFNFQDSTLKGNEFEKSHFMMIESVTERKYIAPNRDFELVKANKVSGFENPQFSMLATQFQTFTFYDDDIHFFNKIYINPVSDRNFSKYDFDLYDSLKTDKDTVYLIAFEPKINKNFEGLKGILYINKKHFALQNVIAEPQTAELINFKIQQKYTLIDGVWFPEQINTDVHFIKYPNPKIGLRIRGQSFISDVKINPDMSKMTFPTDKLALGEDANKQNEEFWQNKRYDTLSAKEKFTYHFIDSLSKKQKLEKIVNAVGYAVVDALPISFLSLKISDLFFKSNSFEGLRLGLHVFSNDKISKYFSLGGYFAYGIKDERIKYGGNLKFFIVKKKDFTINFYYQNDLAEPTRQAAVFTEMKTLGNLWLIAKADKTAIFGSEISLKPFRFADFILAGAHEKRECLYEYGFQTDISPAYRFENAAIKAHFRYAYGEKFAQSYGARYSLGTNSPVIIFSVSKGFSGLKGSDFDYEKYQFQISKIFRSRIIGTTSISCEAGILNGNVPYSLLFGARALTGVNARFVYQYNAFQTMGIYEFASEKYVHFHLEHSFGKLLFRKKNFEPEPAFAFNVGYGEMNRTEKHRGATFMPYDKIFYESGFLIYNLLKMNYLNIAKLGFGGGVFYRMGDYAFPKPEDNLNYKVLLRFNF